MPSSSLETITLVKSNLSHRSPLTPNPLSHAVGEGALWKITGDPPAPLSHAVGEGALWKITGDPPAPLSHSVGEGALWKITGDPPAPLSHSVGEGPGVRAENTPS